MDDKQHANVLNSLSPIPHGAGSMIKAGAGAVGWLAYGGRDPRRSDTSVEARSQKAKWLGKGLYLDCCRCPCLTNRSCRPLVCALVNLASSSRLLKTSSAPFYVRASMIDKDRVYLVPSCDSTI